MSLIPGGISINSVEVGTGSSPNDGTGDDIRTAFIKYNDAINYLAANLNVINNFAANKDNTILANLTVTNRVIGNLYLEGADTIFINGSAVTTADVTFPGGAVPNAADFQSPNSSTSPDTGAVIISQGGLGVAENIYAGGMGVFSGNIVAAATTDSTSIDSASLLTRGGLSVARKARIGETLTVTGSTTLSSALSVSGSAAFSAMTESSNATTGAVVISGGAGISGNLNVGGNTEVQGNVTVRGGLRVDGVTSFGAQTLNITDNIITLNTNSNEEPKIVDDGRDIGVKYHYFKPGRGNSFAFLGWKNNTGYMDFYAEGTETANEFDGTIPGTYRGGGFLSTNVTPSTSTTTGAIITAGGLGVAGAVYAGSLNGPYFGTVQTSNQPNITSVGTLTSLSVSGSLSASGISGTLTTAAQPNITSVGTLTSLSVSGSLSASGITGVLNTATQPNITSVGTLTSLSVSGSLSASGITGVLNTATQPNITSVGTLTSLAVSGAVSAGSMSVSGGISGTLTTANQLNVTRVGTLTSLTVSGGITGVLTTAAQPNITSVGTLTSLAVSSGITASTVVATSGVTGVLNTATQPNITSVGTLTSLAVSGAVSAGSMSVSGGISGTLTTANQLNVTRVGTLTSLAVSGGISGTLTTAAQPNITSVGTLTSLAVSGGISGTLTTAAQPNITSVGTITSGVWNGSTIAANRGGTGQTTYSNGQLLIGNGTTGTLNKATLTPGLGIEIANTAGGIEISANVDVLSAGTVKRVDTGAGLTGGPVLETGTISVALGGITNGMLRNSAALSVMGRAGSSNGDVADIAAGSDHQVLRRSGTALGFGAVNLSSTNAVTGTLPVARGGTGITSLGAGVAAFLSTPNSTNLRAAVTDETGTGALVFSTSPVFGTRITTPAIVKSGANGSGDIGQSANRFGTVYATATSALYADLAEIYAADTNYEPGTVVIFGGAAEITTTTEFSDRRVAGVISTEPAYLMNAHADGLPVALRGRVPVKVTGKVRKGDLLVTSKIPGVAIAHNQANATEVFAKAIADKHTDAVGVIEAVIL